MKFWNKLFGSYIMHFNCLRCEVRKPSLLSPKLIYDITLFSIEIIIFLYVTIMPCHALYVTIMPTIILRC